MGYSQEWDFILPHQCLQYTRYFDYCDDYDDDDDAFAATYYDYVQATVERECQSHILAMDNAIAEFDANYWLANDEMVL